MLNTEDDSSDKRSAVNRARRLRKIGSKLPPPYPNGWFAIATSKEIMRGKAKNIECLGEHFVVFRASNSNEVFVLDAYCPHMGANLGVGGIVKNNCVECPFHQWRFNGDNGELVNIPYSENLSEVEKFAKIRKWISTEVNGIIFVWYHAENEQPWILPTVDEVNDGSWVYHGANEFTINCHIQDIPENGADRAHLTTVHGTNIAAGMDVCKSRESIFSFGTHIWDAKWAVNDDLKHQSIIKLTHVFNVLSFKLLKIDSDIRQIGPAFVILTIKTIFGNAVIFQTLTPLEPLVQKLSHYFYAPWYLAWFVKFLIWGETVNVGRDVMIWNSKEFIKNPLLPKEEKQIKLFRNWFSQFYSENSKSFQDAHQSLDW
ncbi:hypothetical protein PVAND_008424 [Polypedilum vanderplanki]|uniref:cholesterol 7-desaturase n=1 Tax=Polypedilum vanderplanki TaxID=319348 RepID=A0A9J6CAL0_POLVA|nr:hypothetical protein PVAND_008424 [Polypedilum vanderplanki]